MDKMFFDKLDLGNIISFEKLSGGITNEMYKVTTDRGSFALKILNNSDPSNEHYNKIEKSEKIASIAYDNGINAVISLSKDDKHIRDIDDKKELIYNYLSAKVKLSNEITLDNVSVIASTLAKLHKIKVDESFSTKYTKNNYKYFYDKLKDSDSEYAKFFIDKFNLLEEIYNKAYDSYLNLKDKPTYIHKDLNRKNIMWEDEVPYIIDWETSEVGHPSIDFFNSAFFMSHDVEENKYDAFVSSYLKENTIDIDNGVYAGIIEECNWLYFSLNRLYSDDLNEVFLGKESIIPSITQIIDYYNKIPIMLKIINKYRTNK